MSRKQRRRGEKRRRHTEGAIPEPRRLQLAAGAGVTVGASLLMGGGVAHAATFTVDSLADPSESGHTTLRDALTAAENSTSQGGTIVFASGLSGTIHLTSQLPEITYPTTIQGPGAGQLAISGDSSTRLLYTGGPTVIAGNQVTISGLALTQGFTQGPDARNGGAIYNYNADLTIANSVLSGNTSLGSSTHDGYGGAICTCTGYGELTVRDSTFSGNTAGGSGGAIYSDVAPLDIQSSTFTGNQAYYRGGAISDCCASYDSTIANSTLAGNSVVGTTPGYGGAVFTYAQTNLTLTGSTVVGNSAYIGGGVAQKDNTPPTLHDTIVAGNTAGFAGPDVGGNADSAFSLIQDTAGATITETVSGSDITGQDPQLGPLQDNGGCTQTMAPLLASPVIDQGSAFGLTEDQRGLTRPVDLAAYPNSSAGGADGSDIGAVELGTNPIPCPTSSQAPTPAGPTGQRAAAVKKCKKKYRKAVHKKKAHHALTPKVKKHLKKKLRKCKRRANQLPV